MLMHVISAWMVVIGILMTVIGVYFSEEETHKKVTMAQQEFEPKKEEPDESWWREIFDC